MGIKMEGEKNIEGSNRPNGQAGKLQVDVGKQETSQPSAAGSDQSAPIETPATVTLQDETTPPTSNLKLETTKMETHAHHLHKAPGKNFWHYFYEFLMLFLAVFCGFLAENQREHYVEKRHEKQFMISLVRDLELDTSQLNRIQRFRQDRLADIDSLTIFFAATEPKMVPLNKYNIVRALLGSIYFFQNSGTLDQLKNSGGLRLIHNRSIVDSIEDYDQQIKRMVVRDHFESDLGIENIQLVGKLFHNSVALKMRADTMLLGKNITTDMDIPINRQYLDEYLNHLMTFQDLIKANLGVQAIIKNRAINLIASIKKEYRLE
jgi:hypothetical protein